MLKFVLNILVVIFCLFFSLCISVNGIIWAGEDKDGNQIVYRDDNVGVKKIVQHWSNEQGDIPRKHWSLGVLYNDGSIDIFGALREEVITNSTKTYSGVKDMVMTERALCLLYDNGSIENFGDKSFGGTYKVGFTCSDIYSTRYFFVCVGLGTQDLHVWGKDIEAWENNDYYDDRAYVYDNGVTTFFEDVYYRIKNKYGAIRQLVTTERAFAVLYNNPRVLESYGDSFFGGRIQETNDATVVNFLNNITMVNLISSSKGIAALNAHSTMIVWEGDVVQYFEEYASTKMVIGSAVGGVVKLDQTVDFWTDGFAKFPTDITSATNIWIYLDSEIIVRYQDGKIGVFNHQEPLPSNLATAFSSGGFRYVIGTGSSRGIILAVKDDGTPFAFTVNTEETQITESDLIIEPLNGSKVESVVVGGSICAVLPEDENKTWVKLQGIGVVPEAINFPFDETTRNTTMLGTLNYIVGDQNSSFGVQPPTPYPTTVPAVDENIIITNLAIGYSVGWVVVLFGGFIYIYCKAIENVHVDINKTTSKAQF